MTTAELKQALVEVRKLCRKNKCKDCGLHKHEEETGVPYCPLYEDEYGMEVKHPASWDIDDWKEHEE